MQLGVMVPHGGVLIGSLVGIACEAIGRRPVWRAYRHMNAAQSRAAALRMETLAATQVPFADTLQEEKWMCQAGMLELLRAPDWRRQLGSLSGVSGGFSGLALEARLQLMPKRRILDSYTSYVNQAIDGARKPYTLAPQMPPIPADPISQILVPDFSLARLKATDNQTQDALLTTTLALWAYRQEHGVYPSTLTALVPGDLRAVPGAPFAATGPLHYKPEGNGYLLYSVGPDGRDDNGAAIFDASEPAPSATGISDRRRFTNQDSKGDIVAGVNIY